MAISMDDKIMSAKSVPLSRLTVGTVQFGLPYGIANSSGQPTYGEARDILATACEGGINSIDTASAYGTSEEVIGRALEELRFKDDFIVTTKVPPVPEQAQSVAEIDSFVEDAVLNSLQRLRLNYLPVCLFHRENDFCYRESLWKLRERGLVRFIGASVEMAEGASGTISIGNAGPVQIPSNLLDRRFLDKGVFQAAKSQGVTLFVRSIYLQGVLLMPVESLIPSLAGLKPILWELRQLAFRSGLTMEELCMRSMLGVQGVSSLVIGVESVAQMRRNLELGEKGALAPDVKAEVDKIVPRLPERMLNPACWATQAKVQEPQVNAMLSVV
jgi:aryl-alcohol dehydrogenase-like predicted oxidoreductase